MKNQLNHEDWISALSNNELSASDIIRYGIISRSEFIWHPLGFIFCKLSEEGLRKIRLHIWPSNNDRMQNPAWLIHDHLFELKSWVIAGEIENTEYSVTDGEPNYTIYNAKYENNKSVLYKTDKNLCLNISHKAAVIFGDTYRVPFGVFHQSISISKTTSLTVCETIDQLNRSPMVAGDMHGLGVYSYIRSKVDRKDLDSIIEKI